MFKNEDLIQGKLIWWKRESEELDRSDRNRHPEPIWVGGVAGARDCLKSSRKQFDSAPTRQI